jgi:hypothetical protein
LSKKQDGRPSLQFYPDDWLSETGLKMCSLAAKGLWIDMLCHMFKSEKRGQLIVNGKVPTMQEVGKLVSIGEAEAKQLVDELLSYGVCESTETSILYNRRMVRDEQIRQSKIEAGRKGGVSKRVKKSKSKTQAEPGSPTPTPTPTPASTPASSSNDTLRTSINLEKVFNQETPTNPAGELTYLFINTCATKETQKPNQVMACVESTLEDYSFDQIKAAIKKVGPQARSWAWIRTELDKVDEQKQKEDAAWADYKKRGGKDERRVANG